MNQLIFYLILLSAVICVFGTHVRVTRTSTNEKKGENRILLLNFLSHWL